MDIKSLGINDVKIIIPQKFQDARGYFMETFNAQNFANIIGEQIEFVQDNHSLSKEKYTVRGLHFQAPPYAQGKLVRCSKGKILDVAVDVRIGSSTFGKHVKAILSEKNGEQLWIPSGFLHAFVTLKPNTEVQYKCTNFYSPECDGNVLWNDSSLKIDWGFNEELAILSEKDASAVKFSSFNSPFKSS